MYPRLSGDHLEFPAAVGSAVAVRLRLLYECMGKIMPLLPHWTIYTKRREASRRFLAEMFLYKVTLVW